MVRHGLHDFSDSIIVFIGFPKQFVFQTIILKWDKVSSADIETVLKVAEP